MRQINADVEPTLPDKIKAQILNVLRNSSLEPSKDEVLLLSHMIDGNFTLKRHRSVCAIGDAIRDYLEIHPPLQALLYALEYRIGIEKKNIIHKILKAPIEDIPLFLNVKKSHYAISAVTKWRATLAR